MKRVLLTGAAGFVGAHCIGLLRARDFEVHAITTRAVATQETRVIWHQADLLDHAQAEALVESVKPSHLLHLAWFVKPGDYWSSPVNYSWLCASLSLLNAFAHNGGTRAVFVGTGAEYNPSAELCIEGKTQLQPSTIYGACKASLSLILPVTAARLGISAAWARLFGLYGPGEYPVRLVPSAIRALLADQPFACTEGRQIRDYVYVEDAAEALAALVDSDTALAVNVGSGEGIALRQIVSTIGAQLQRAHLLRFGAKPTPANETSVQVADVARLKHELRWLPRVPLEEGIRRTIEWWKNQDT